MVFPLEELVKYQDNIYEVTVAASRRAFQMARIEDPEIEAHEGKVVSLAAQQVFDDRVTFKIEEQ
ncbi:MAG: DNA-directed RNA polymerase subunit omega [Treponema sp.]|nr:DNA-directed RNA polymerase subunit omega [Treponema sp.]